MTFFFYDHTFHVILVTSLSPSPEDFSLCYHLRLKKNLHLKSMICFELIFI